MSVLDSVAEEEGRVLVVIPRNTTLKGLETVNTVFNDTGNFGWNQLSKVVTGIKVPKLEERIELYKFLPSVKIIADRDTVQYNAT